MLLSMYAVALSSVSANAANTLSFLSVHSPIHGRPLRLATGRQVGMDEVGTRDDGMWWTDDVVDLRRGLPG